MTRSLNRGMQSSLMREGNSRSMTGGGVFLIGCDSEFIKALLERGVPIEGLVPDVMRFTTISSQCRAQFVALQEQGLAGLDLEEVVTRIRVLMPKAGLVVLVSPKRCSNPEALGVLAHFNPPFNYEQIAQWFLNKVLQVQECRLFAQGEEGSTQLASVIGNLSEENRGCLREVEWRRLDNPLRNVRFGLKPDTVVRQHTVAFLNPKGGVGRTYLAINLAARLAALKGLRVLLMDLDFSVGDIGLFLNLKQFPTILDLLPLLPNLEHEDFVRFRISISSLGFDVLLGPGKLELGDLISAEHIQTLLLWLTRHYDVILIDTDSNAFDDRLATIVSLATKVILILTPDPASVRHGRLCMDALKDRRVNLGDRVLIVVNRMHPGRGLPSDEVYRVFGVYPVAGIPEEGEKFYSALMSGSLSWVGGTSQEATEAMKGLAAVLYPLLAGETAVNKSGRLISRLLKGAAALPIRLVGR